MAVILRAAVHTFLGVCLAGERGFQQKRLALAGKHVAACLAQFYLGRQTQEVLLGKPCVYAECAPRTQPLAPPGET